MKKMFLIFNLLFVLCFSNAFSMEYHQELLGFAGKFDEACHVRNGEIIKASIIFLVLRAQVDILLRLSEQFFNIDQNILQSIETEDFVGDLRNNLWTLSNLLIKRGALVANIYGSENVKVIIDDFCRTLGFLYDFFMYVVKYRTLPPEEERRGIEHFADIRVSFVREFLP